MLRLVAQSIPKIHLLRLRFQMRIFFKFDYLQVFRVNNDFKLLFFLERNNVFPHTLAYPPYILFFFKPRVCSLSFLVFLLECSHSVHPPSFTCSFRNLGLAEDPLVEEAKKEEEEASKSTKSNFLVSRFKRWNSKSKT